MKHETAIETLSRSHVDHPDQLPSRLQAISEVVARTLDVARVAVWQADPRKGVLRCHELYERDADRHSTGVEWSGDACASVLRALDVADVIAAADVARDPRTAIFAAAHFEPLGVTSAIGVPIRSKGALIGVLSCEHIGDCRTWSHEAQTFAVAVANLLSSLFAQVERQRLEAQLRQAQKLEEIGRLAGGVAHDFNNVLTVILGKAGRIADDPRLPEDLRAAVLEIAQSGERAARLTRQLLAFSRQQPIDMRDLDLNDRVGGLSQMLRSLLGEQVAVTLRYGSPPAWVRADASMLDQVILNLAVNARDAMPHGGTLSIETAVADVGVLVAAAAGRQPGPYVCMTVSDTGCGIPAEHLPHIFEPFFTTKDVGKGTGLGLATTYGIVQQHHGWIAVDSEVGHGTVFKVYLPYRSSPEIAAQPANLPAADPTIRGGETILVVEDEAPVRSIIVEALMGYGYVVLEAESGAAALAAWQQHGATVDLLITDVIMPDGVNGLELAHRLRDSDPELRVVYISGYPADVSTEDLRRDGDSYLAKPFSLPALARHVRDRLDR